MAYLISLLASMLYGYLKQHITSLASVPISEVSHGKFSNVAGFFATYSSKRTQLRKQSWSFYPPTCAASTGHIIQIVSVPLCYILCSFWTNISVSKMWERASLFVQRFSVTQPLISVSLSLSPHSHIFFFQLENN